MTARKEATEAACSPGRTGGLLIDSQLCTVPKEMLCLLAVPFLNYPEKLLVRLAGGRAHGALKKSY